MIPRWQDIRCASIPVEDLSVLADLRHEATIRVTIERVRAWICWDDETGTEAMRHILAARLLPLAGVEIFARRDGRWHRPGESLPAFGVPIGDSSGGVKLDRLIVPERLTISRPRGASTQPVPLRLVRDPSGEPRPTSAARFPLVRLAEWAERAPSPWIESLSAAWSTALGGPADAEVLVLGPAVRLAISEDARRYWGKDVLIPLGYRAEPELADHAMRNAVRAAPEDLVILEADGAELVSRAAFRPLSRAGIRLAMAELRPGRTSEESRS